MGIATAGKAKHYQEARIRYRKRRAAVMDKESE